MLPTIYRSDQYHYSLITDIKRNQFYEKILSHEVSNKVCVEIGFGTGILSFLAIKYGAKHIYAYEMDRQLYEIGQYLIEQLELSDRITLTHKIFNKDDIPDDCDLIFHEVLGRNIWDEHIFSLLNNKQKVIPSTYFGEFYCYELTNEEFNYFTDYTDLNAVKLKNQKLSIDPGISIDERYKTSIEKILDLVNKDRNLLCISQSAFIKDGFHAKLLYDSIIAKASKIAEYELDVNTKKVKINNNEVNFNLHYIDIKCSLNLDKDKNYLILPNLD